MTGSDEDDDNETAPGAELTLGEKFFKPLYLLSIWKEPGTMTKRVTAAVILPSGVETGDFSICISPCGMSLEIAVVWPVPLVDLTCMHKKWLRPESGSGFQVFYPRYTGFEQVLKKIKQRSSDDVQSIARIPLTFAVQTHIDSKSNTTRRENGVHRHEGIRGTALCS